VSNQHSFAGLGEHPPSLISRLTKDIPTSIQVLGLVSGFIGVAVPGIGYLTHERRVQLLDLPREVFEYGPYQAALTGCAALWHLPWRMVNAMTVGNTLIRLVAITALVIAFFRKPLLRRWRNPRMSLAAVTLLMVLVAISGKTYSNLITLQRDQQPSMLSDHGRATTFEWLQNPNDANNVLVDALAGVIGWLILAATVAAIEFKLLARSPVTVVSRSAWAGVVSSCVALFFLIGQLPTAHAYASWGFRYPKVVGLSPKFDDTLAALLTGGKVWAWDVSLGAKAEYLLVKEAGQPWRLQPMHRSGGGRCAALGAEEVIALDTNVRPAAKDVSQ
jgi:hypothetical protein